MEQRHSCEPNRSSGWGNSGILWKPKVHHRTHKSTPPVPILSQIDQSVPPSHFSKIHFNIILPCTPGSPKLSPYIRVFHQNPVLTTPIPHPCYMHCSLQSALFVTRIMTRGSRRFGCRQRREMHSKYDVSSRTVHYFGKQWTKTLLCSADFAFLLSYKGDVNLSETPEAGLSVLTRSLLLHVTLIFAETRFVVKIINYISVLLGSRIRRDLAVRPEPFTCVL